MDTQKGYHVDLATTTINTGVDEPVNHIDSAAITVSLEDIRNDLTLETRKEFIKDI
jgi:hypothetical protein